MSERLPDGLTHVRTTKEFDQGSTPPGLLGAHVIADGVWGRLVVRTGSLGFRFEDDPSERRVEAGHDLVIPPKRPHRVVLGDADVTFAIEFHRRAED